LAALALAAALLGAAAGCTKPTTFPTPILETEELAGALEPGGESVQTFTVEYPFTGTDATVTILSLTLAATGAPVDSTIGLGFGTLAGDGCTRATSSTQDAANVGQEYTTQGNLFFPGLYCVSIFDPAGTLPGTTNYVLRIKHY
jgi:hypothetical protein